MSGSPLKEGSGPGMGKLFSLRADLAAYSYDSTATLGNTSWAFPQVRARSNPLGTRPRAI